jgi:2-oxoglutarate ferredoxin oxidoreductase subunit beta
MSEHVLDKFFKYDKLPTTLCPGCGNGIVFQALARAIDKLGYSHDEIIVFTGVGCASRACVFMDVTGAQTIHGRPITFATGAKMANPNLKVFVVAGDGDATSIGGNHFIHACRRNIDLNIIVCNNSNYGMTGGQYSASTPTGSMTKTSVLGHIEPCFDVCKLAEGAGATFVARSTTYHIGQMVDLIVKGAQHKGVSVIDAMCDCPTQYGRFNKLGDAAGMIKRWKDVSVGVEKAKNLSDDELKDKIVIGKLYENTELPEFTERYAELVSRAKEVKK